VNWFRRMRHRLAHFLGLNGGHVETYWDENGVLWVGFRCDGCGELSHEQRRYD